MDSSIAVICTTGMRNPARAFGYHLSQILALITARKTADLVKRERARKRGGGRVTNASALAADWRTSRRR